MDKFNKDMQLMFETIQMLGQRRQELIKVKPNCKEELEDMVSAIRALLVVYGTWHFYQVEDSFHD